MDARNAQPPASGLSQLLGELRPELLRFLTARLGDASAAEFALPEIAAGAEHVHAAEQQQLRGDLGRLFAVAENYPDLKANQNFLALQEELTATEGRVAYARQFYNDSVLGYNNRRWGTSVSVWLKLTQMGSS